MLKINVITVRNDGYIVEDLILSSLPAGPGIVVATSSSVTPFEFPDIVVADTTPGVGSQSEFDVWGTFEPLNYEVVSHPPIVTSTSVDLLDGWSRFFPLNEEVLLIMCFWLYVIPVLHEYFLLVLHYYTCHIF